MILSGLSSIEQEICQTTFTLSTNEVLLNLTASHVEGLLVRGIED